MFQQDLFKDQTIIITGGGTGLGLAMGSRLAELGANLVITSRSQNHLDAGAEQLRSLGAKVLTVPCDVRDPEAVEAMIAKATEFDTITGLINNAAGNIASPTEMLSPNAFKAVVEIVLHGSYYCTQNLGKHWISTGTAGRVLSIVTTYAWTGSGFVVPSACAKAGVLAMTRSLAAEWGRHGIRLNAVAPGPFPTDGAWQRLVPKSQADSWVKRIPAGRVGEHEELANLSTFLMSPQADYITGSCVTIDGGEWIQGAGQFNWMSELSGDDWANLASQARKK